MNLNFFIYYKNVFFNEYYLLALYSENARGENIAFGSVKETKVAKELFSLCSISIFAAFIR